MHTAFFARKAESVLATAAIVLQIKISRFLNPPCNPRVDFLPDPANGAIAYAPHFA
jgi:hypothetical protein